MQKIEIIKKAGIEDGVYIGAVAFVQIRYANGKQYDGFSFIYEPSYLGKFTNEEVFTTFGMFELMVAIVVATVGLVIITSTIYKLYRRCGGYTSPDILNEETVDKPI
jgi:hypothetical protein